MLTGAASAQQHTIYDSRGNVVGRSATDSSGTVTNYDAGGRVISRESTSGNTTTIDEPIILPDGRKLKTLRDAATYITALPKAQANLKRWQTAMQTLLLVADRDGPRMMARIAMLQALDRGSATEKRTPVRKRAKAYRFVR